MALTKIGKEGITGVSNSANATFLTATSAEGVTLAGTLAVTGVHTDGTNAVATSDGGAATTSIVQGLAKIWANLDGGGTAALRDSFNLTNFTDEGTGDYTFTIANDMANASYSTTSHTVDEDGSGNNVPIMGGKRGATPATGSFRVACNFHADSTSSLTDHTHVCVAVFGDLA